MISIEQIRKWVNGTWLRQAEETFIDELIIDTRKIADAENGMFVALATPRRNGHKYIEAAYEKGIRNFMVSEAIPVSGFENAGFILVKDTQQAIQQMAAAHRKQFSIPVIGITGSNGKTVIKEWLYQLLAADKTVVRSPRSYNSQIGVPLSVWQMNASHELGIFEAGISQTGEMEKLELIIRPTIGIFTNIGEAHSEGFLNQRQKVNEKLVLFRHVKQLIYCSDHMDVNEAVLQYRNQLQGDDKDGMQLFTWSQKHDADLKITSIKSTRNQSVIEGLYQKEACSITIPFSDPASIENAIHCWCTLLLLHVEQPVIEERMKELHAVAMRLELRQGINDCTIINDIYNSDLTSLHIALDFLEQQKQHDHHTVILSDMLQMGKSDADLYQDVADFIERKNVQRFIGVGPALSKYQHLFANNKKLKTVFFKSTEDLLQKIHLINFRNEAILLKAARAFEFEKIDLLLEQKVHQTVLSINLSSLVHNLNVFRNAVGNHVKIMAMVKAFSYGSGSFEIAHVLQYAGVDYLTVAYTDEGVSLRKAGIKMPIMVMSPDASSFDRMIAWKLEPEIFNMHSLNVFLKMAETLQVTGYPVHIKLDTGMHRLGFLENELDELVQTITKAPQVKVATVFSHLVASEDASFDGFTEEQAANFVRMSSQLATSLGYMPIRHLCNSAAIARHQNLHFDMVRLGLGLYGIDGSGVLQNKLRQISSLKTTIAQIKEVKAGETVGYGRKGLAHENTRIATICIGYADGYPRALGNGKAHVLIHGKKAKIVGVVCMDMCMVDISDIPEAQEGDEVTIFSSELPLTQLAQWSDTISYEIMTGISQRVKRVYVNED
ncbi:MAG TPA: bifunctional UDP-N-acetylmuramoyl-tripeptide:D-alanyl-D-alanine ligase/alanine racemase [Flavipsychrobacter sp.]|nr:bifunctional UDP-N-acetylmuramoyl-tripeptide:D-alanyl-D-alanine ligase/alanine racemase [Flavipsychrobacter sp.]